MDPFWLALPGFFFWLVVLFLPWRPWSTRESLDASASSREDLSGLTVLIPARNEEDVIIRTLKALDRQGQDHRIIVIDDQSTDDTAALASQLKIPNLEIVPGAPLQAGWTGKLWALEQGRTRARTDYLLLLDADIELRPGLIRTLLEKLHVERLELVSLMAYLRMENVWEKLLMPAFIYFFKLLYPFRISNSPSPYVAAAAGGCILIRAAVLEEIGGFGAIRGQIIDDCALARAVKQRGYRTWIGLTHSAVSHRQYNDIRTIWDMVARTAFTQLRSSTALLLACSLLLLIAFAFPPAALVLGGPGAATTALAGLAVMAGTYIPTLRYYDLSPAWALALPLVGVLYMAMTWTSAFRHWRGSGARWKERSYGH